MSTGNASQLWLSTQRLFQKTALIAIVGLAIVAIASSAAALLGVVPWLSFDARYGPSNLANTDMISQLVIALLAVSLCFYLPSHRRILALETSHREFNITMDDVAHAYALAHKADREEAFTLSAEFDAVRERIQFMRGHPDRTPLEQSVLEVASQISTEVENVVSIATPPKTQETNVSKRSALPAKELAAE